MKRCIIENCDNKYHAKGYCSMHYSRVKSHGDPNTVLPAGMHRKYKSLEERFLSSFIKKDDDDCWIWNGTVNGGGYGHMEQERSKWITAHRFSYALFMGIIPKNMFVCHTCDHRNCVNPHHLFLGTADDNNKDKMRKGRCNSLAGSKNPSAKLSEVKIIKIKQLLHKGLTHRNIAILYNVSRTTIGYIKNNKTWKQV